MKIRWPRRKKTLEQVLREVVAKQFDIKPEDIILPEVPRDPHH